MVVQILKKGFLMLIIFNALTGYSMTGEKEEKNPAFQFKASYKGDVVSNFRGGLQPGSTYLGLVDLYLGFNAENAGLWKGASFLIHGANSHGGEPSSTLVGDFQGFTNIEAGNHTFLYELWYKQSFSRLTATIGLQDLSSEFANSAVSGLFINSSFGVHSVIADNIAAPIFPITKPGITLCADLSRGVTLKSALYHGCLVDFETNPHNLDWNLDEKGYLWITEGEYSWTGSHEKDNTLKGGAFFHQHCEQIIMDPMSATQFLSHDYGLYLVGEHTVSFTNNKCGGLKIFYQAGLSPRNDNFGYFGLGCAYSGLFCHNGADVLGLALANGMLKREVGRDETSFELTYKVQLNHQIYLQPDLQYVVHPGGTDAQLKNATVGLLRLGMEF